MTALPSIPANELQYVRYQVTDLKTAQTFLTDFGMTVAAKQGNSLFLRGTTDAPFIYEAVLGSENKFLGAGFKVGALSELQRLCSLKGSSAIEPTGAPGGGQRVRMRMDDGFEIDAVYGATPAVPLKKNRVATALNTQVAKPRLNASVRIQRVSSPVGKLGHFVLHVLDHAASVVWLQERFGLVASDYLATPDAPEQPIGSFLRVDHGKTLVDHHCMLVLGTPHPGVHHCSFEVEDIDAVMAAHDFLLERGYTLDCGVGRHLLGSQIFDYWRDPFGFRIEHYTDGDVVNSDYESSIFAGTADQTTQWGAKPPAEFFQ